MPEKPRRYLLFSVDTEPDSPDWKGYAPDSLTYRNFAGLRGLAEMAAGYGVKPTFFVTYSSAGREELQAALGTLQQGTYEIGAHLHPGDTPPFGAGSDNILAVPPDLLAKKFSSLHGRITSCFGTPFSFRAGAWTIDKRVISLLRRHGYTADSSVTPGISWLFIGRPSYAAAPACAYRLSPENPALAGNSPVLEIPVSILKARRLKGLAGELLAAVFSMPLESRRGFVYGLLKKCRSLRPLWLRPAFATVEQMKIVAENTTADFAHVMCHSNELWPGASPYSPTAEKCRSLRERLGLFFSFARDAGYNPLTLSEYAALHRRDRAGASGAGRPREHSWS